MRTQIARIAAGAALIGVLFTGGPAAAQDAGARLTVNPSADRHSVFLIERTEAVYRGPVGGKASPEKTQMTSLVRVERKSAEPDGTSTLSITFLRVRGAVSGGRLPEPVTFDRNTKDSPDGRAETALVGRTVEMDVRADGTVIGVRGVDAESTGSASVAIATVGDLTALVTKLPEKPVVIGSTWTAETLEGRGLLRRLATTKNRLDGTTGAQAVIQIDGLVSPSPENAPQAFVEGIKMEKGTRRATYRIALSDGLPVVARHETEFVVEAPLTGSDANVRVAIETTITVRRRDGADDTIAAPNRAPESGGKTRNERMPAWIGTPRAAIERQLGEPTSTWEVEGQRHDTFDKLGLSYAYDTDGTVSLIVAKLSPGGASFAGKILGVGIGDRVSEAEALWGRPTRRTAADSGHDMASFVFDDLTLELEITRDSDRIVLIRVSPTK